MRKKLKSFETVWGHSLVSNLLCKVKFLALALKKYPKTDINAFRSCLICLISYFCLKIFTIGLSLETDINV